MTVDPRITEILADRKTRQEIVNAAVNAAQKSGVRVTTQSIPAAPATTSAPATVPTPTPDTVPATETQLTTLIDAILPRILTGIADARAAFGDKKLAWDEALTLGQTVIAVVSAAVREGAPLVRGQDARALVIAIFGVVFDKLIADRLPLWLTPFRGIIRGVAVTGLQAAYDALVKKK